MNLLNNFSKEESARRVHNIGCCHSASHQFTNHNSRQFRDDACSSGLRSVPHEIETEIEELFKKDKDVCIICGYVSANEFFSFPSDVDTRQQWATFCDLAFDMVKAHFRLCDRHFKPDDYRISIQRKLLIPTSVPTLQPKVKNGFAPSINNCGLQSSANFINFSNPTLSKNASKNAIYSPVFQSNTTTDASNKQFRRIFGDITNKYDDDVPPKAKKLASKRKLKLKQSQQQTKCFRSEIFRLRTRCCRLEDTVAELRKRIERLDDRCFVVPEQTDRNIAEDTRDGRLTIYSSEKSDVSFCTTEAQPTKRHKKVAFVETAVNCVDGTHQPQSLTPLLPVKSHDDPVTITEEYSSAKSFMRSLEISSTGLYNSEKQREQFSEEVALPETARNMSEDARNTNSINFLREEWNDSHDTNAAPEQYSVGVASIDISADTQINDNENTFNANFTIQCLENPDNTLHNADARSAQYFEEDPASEDSGNCFSDLTKATDVFLKVLDDDINCQLRRNDTSANLNNEQSDKAHVGQTLQMEQVKVTTQQPNCNDELNAFQRNGQPSPLAGCSKRQKNGDEGQITRSPKKKKGLPSVDSSTQTSDRAPKKVKEVLTQDSPPYCCNICDKTFTVKSDWRTHQRKHPKPFLCSKCNKKPFAYKSSLFRHQASQGKNRFKCGICDARYINVANYIIKTKQCLRISTVHAAKNITGKII